ncbi:hypothetical protein GCM10023169_26080 [Georgenia halophila]|uniref:Protein-glutamine gamma-glutamyltransferase-like C-terminal domain-containing protein n=1 Tax=Georgenia halophila TaxID=620889 RepID=A0ABP8LC49_9MICO
MLAAALTAVALLVLVWGSSGQLRLLPQPVTGDGGPPQSRDRPTVPADQMTPLLPPPSTGEQGAEALTVEWDLVLAVGILLALALLLVAWRVWRWWRRRETDRSLPDDDEPDFEVMLRATGAQAQRRAAEGDPRNAIVSCWVSLEDAAERAGLDRQASETATEFTSRVLTAWDVDPATITELGDLYRAARFSREPITEADRRRAVAALGRVHEAITAYEAAPDGRSEVPT